MIQHLAVKYYTQGLDSDDVLMSLSAHILSLFLAADSDNLRGYDEFTTSLRIWLC